LQLFCLCLPAPCTHAAGFQAALRPRAQAIDNSQPASAAALQQLWAIADQTTAADCIARFEATVAPHIAAEALSEASLEDLRLQTPALRPVRCWGTGCALAACGCLERRGKVLFRGEYRLTSMPCPRRCRNLSGVTEAGLRLQLCSGCNTARYCSEACQRAAWRAGHNGACRRLRARA